MTTPPAAPTVPDGSRMVSDSAGFSFAVPVQWDRESREGAPDHVRGSTGRAELKVGVIRNTPYTSYENFQNLERTADADQRNYRRLQLGANTFQGLPGAIWESPRPRTSRAARRSTRSTRATSPTTAPSTRSSPPSATATGRSTEDLRHRPVHLDARRAGSSTPPARHRRRERLGRSMPRRRVTAIERSLRALTMATTLGTPAARPVPASPARRRSTYPLPQCARPSRQPISISPFGPQSAATAARR